MVRNIYAPKLFFGEINEKFMTFRHSETPPNIHYTFSYHPDSEYVNFHVSKNTGKLPKPQIQIIRIKKDDLDFFLPRWFVSILRKRLEIVTTEELKNKHANIQFVTLKELDNEIIANEFQQAMVNSFMPVYSVKGKRLEVQLNDNDLMEECTLSLMNTGLFQKYMEGNTSDLSGIYENGDAAFAFNDEELFELIHINGNWYTSKKDFRPIDMLYAFCDKEYADSLIACTNYAIEILSNPKVVTMDDVHLEGYVVPTIRRNSIN